MKSKTHSIIIFVIFTVISVLSFLNASLSQANLTDIDNDPRQYSIQELFDMGIITGDPEGTFRGGQSLNRAELLALALRSFFREHRIKERRGGCFWDIPDDQWYTKYVCLGEEMGVVKGHPDGSFRPEDNVSYVEALAMFLRLYEYDVNYDIEGQWYEPYLIFAQQNKVLSDVGYAPGSFITRSDSAFLTHQIVLDEDEIVPLGTGRVNLPRVSTEELVVADPVRKEESQNDNESDVVKQEQSEAQLHSAAPEETPSSVTSTSHSTESSTESTNDSNTSNNVTQSDSGNTDSAQSSNSGSTNVTNETSNQNTNNQVSEQDPPDNTAENTNDTPQSDPPQEPDSTPAEAPIPSISLGDLVIDPTRIPLINAPYERPDTSGWTIVNFDPGLPKTSQELQNAINAMDPFSVLVLPAGNYSGTLGIYDGATNSNKVVRGQCNDVSAVTWSNTGEHDNVLFNNGILCDEGWSRLCGTSLSDISASSMFGPSQAWSGPYTRGTTTLNISSSAGFSVGDIVRITSAPPPEAETDNLHYISEIVAVSPGQITIQDGLHIDFLSTNAFVTELLQPLRNSGLECMTMEQPDYTNPANLYDQRAFTTGYAYESWVWNMDFGNVFNNHALIDNSAKILMASSYIGEQGKSLQGDGNTCNINVPVENNPCWNKQAVLFRRSHDSSMVDNVIHSSVGVELAHSSSGNWIAYNYAPFPQFHPSGEPRRALFPHGNYAYANVLEGNFLENSAGEMDQIWGPQGPRYTWFRNVATGPQARFSTEALLNAPAGELVSTLANYILNYGTRFGLAGIGIDSRSFQMHLERNVYTDAFLTGTDPSAVDTTLSDNYDAGISPLGSQWDGFDFPDTLNQSLNQVPSFWCSNTVSNGGVVCDFAIEGGIGALWDGSCILPAQAREDNLQC